MKMMTLPSAIFALCVMIFCMSPDALFAQKSAAELISSVTPPVGVIRYNDGVRQVEVHNDHLFVTNFWAGLQVVDISDVRQPKQIAYLPSENQAYSTFIEKDRAYLANHSAGVVVYDISDITSIRKLSQVKTTGNAYDVWVEYPYIYVALGRDGFSVMDISDLENPTTAKLEIPGSWIQDVFKQGDLLYMAAKKGGLIIYDVSDLENLRLLAQYKTGYNSMEVEVVGDVAYVADGKGGLLMVNVSNPEFPVKISRFASSGFVGDIYKVGNYVYVANSDIGLQIINTTDEDRPFLETVYSTDDKAYGVFKQDIYVYLAANTSTLIMRHNNAPKLENLDDMELNENIPFSLQLKAEEPDGDPIIYNALNIPTGSTFDINTGYFSWNPDYEQSGKYVDIVFSVIEQNENGLSAKDTISLNVQHVNRLPDLPALEDKTIAENNTLTYTIPAGSDPDVEDQERLAYRAEKLPEGATFDPTTRTVSWTPSFEQSGRYLVDFIIDDGGGGSDREPVTFTVTHVDRKPTIDPVAAQSVDEAQTLEVKITGTELDNEDLNKITFQMQNLPSGATFDKTTQTFSWTPNYEQSGIYEDLMCIMRAGALSDTTYFSVTTNHVNRSPSLADIPNQSVKEDKSLNFSIFGSDADQEDEGKLVIVAGNLPDGATFDSESNTFDWMPTFEQAGVYENVTFTITDPDGLSDTKAVTIDVLQVNRPPSITDASDQVIDEDQSFTLQLSAQDADKEDVDKLSYSATGLPAGANLDAKSGLLSWKPNFDQSGSYEVIFAISDEEFNDTTKATFTVNHVNRSPIIDEIAEPTINENEQLTFTITGSDPDVEDTGALEYGVESVPEGALFNPSTRVFNWTPTYEQSGTYELIFTLTDPSGVKNTRPVSVTVNHTNREPVIDPIVAQYVDEDKGLDLLLTGSDPDVEDEGKLVFSIGQVPAGATIDAKLGTFNWRPTYDQSGNYSLTAIITDGDGLSSSQPFTITVNNINRAPSLESITPPQVDENRELRFALIGIDPDAEDEGKLVFSVDNLPAGASLDKISNEFIWTPSFTQSGEHTVSFKVEDTFGEASIQDVTITVNNVNQEPLLPEAQPFSFREDSEASFVLPEGSDPDTDRPVTLVYQLAGLPSGASFDAETRTISWKPDFDQSGEYPLTYSVTDGEAETSIPIQLLVENLNRAPVLETPENRTVKEGSSLRLTVDGSDPDNGDQLTFSAQGLPAGARFDAASRTFSWTPDTAQQGTYTVAFAVSDSGGLTNSVNMTITVEDVPEVLEETAPPESGAEDPAPGEPEPPLEN